MGGQSAPGFGSSSWLSGRSITIQVPAGQFNEVVAVRLWGRECEGANLNPLNSQLSNEQIIRIRRILPTITGITASRTTLTCGDQRPLTLTATTSQQGATSFTWSLPAGWSFAPGSATTGASVSVVPTGSGGGTVSATATYNCAGYTTAAGSTTIGYSPQVATPAFSQVSVNQGTVPSLVCAGEVVTATAAGAGGSVLWSGSPGVTISPNPSVSGQQVSITSTQPGLLTVTAQAGNPSLGCQPSAPISFSFVRERAPLTYANNPMLLAVNGRLADENRQPGPAIVGRPTTLEAYQILDFYAGPVSSFRWEIDGQEPANSANRVSIGKVFRQVGTSQVCLIVTNRCGAREYYCWQVPVQTSGEPTDEEYLRRAFPNPADATLTLEQPAGTELTIVNSQGQPVYKGRESNMTHKIDTRAWPAGLYFLQMRRGQELKRRQIQIKH